MPTDWQTQALADIDRVLSHRLSASDSAGGMKQERAIIYHACIRRWASDNSVYTKQAAQLAADRATQVAWHLFEGILRALRADIVHDGLKSFAELLHADQLGDFLAQANALAESGYRAAAVVVAGATLEEHLRQLSRRHAVDTIDAGGGPRQAAALNSDLYSRASAYTKAEHAQVDAWQKCRNMAAHGDPLFTTAFDVGDVRRLIEGIGDFVRRHPA